MCLHTAPPAFHVATVEWVGGGWWYLAVRFRLRATWRVRVSTGAVETGTAKTGTGKTGTATAAVPTNSIASGSASALELRTHGERVGSRVVPLHSQVLHD